MPINMKKLKKLNKNREKNTGGDTRFIIINEGKDFLLCFGKYKDKKISELFDDEDSQQYLMWLYGLEDIDEEIIDIMDIFIEKYI